MTSLDELFTVNSQLFIAGGYGSPVPAILAVLCRAYRLHRQRARGEHVCLAASVGCSVTS